MTALPLPLDQPEAVHGPSFAVPLGSAIGAKEAKAFVATLDSLTNDQLADVLAFIIGKLCPNYCSRPAGRE